MHQYRNSYQEIEHLQPFSAVTKYSVMVETVEQLPHLVRQAFREATSGATGPVHLDLQGISGDVITDGEADLELVIEESFIERPAFHRASETQRILCASEALWQAGAL